MRVFPDRSAAGRELAGALLPLGLEDPIVLALPRGGVPVGYEVAHLMGAPLDVLVVRKVGAPDQPELAIGAVGAADVTVADEQTMALVGVGPEVFTALARAEQAEVTRRDRMFREGQPPLDLRGRHAILVDDGLATGATMQAAVEVARRLGAAQVIVAVPVGAPEACERLAQRADRVVCLFQPDAFVAVGYWYRDFAQTDDAEVIRLLRLARQERDAPATPAR
ncbi:MAG TPA: phosphoribosyltransferase family protein [Gemmatimonadales bacterium]|nr:phosphoribosyltransferase family protein [Gemmatimonadales bacterium]